MTKIDIFSGFLGAGKTTLIKKLIAEAYKGEKLVLVENEFGEIGVDGTFMQDAGIIVNELNSGCICCSLVGDFSAALRKVIAEYAPDRILIEPSGVGKLSDVITAVQNAGVHGAVLNTFTTVVDATKAKMYLKNFGEFFLNQVENASCIVFSHTDIASEKKLNEALEIVREHNPGAVLIMTPLSELPGSEILSVMEEKDTLEAELRKLKEEHEKAESEEAHHHHHDDDDDECCCGHHHDHDEDGEEHEHHHHHHHDDDEDDDEEEHEHHHHHHHDDDDDEEEHEHHHHHDDGDDECCCGHHHDHEGHHHHHHADEVFQSWGVQTVKKFGEEELNGILEELCDEHRFGSVLRAKGVVPASDGGFIHFDYIPGEPNVRRGSAAPVGMLCVIGAGLKEEELKTLFGV
ncbi:MAG: GTP-binding protein [Clostridia bacterium]|nr:GTP-binding protein [Clostridia bacterium]